MNELTRISPVTDEQAVAMVRPGTLADLAAQITATPIPAAVPALASSGAAAPSGAPARSRRPRTRLALIAVPLAAGAAAMSIVLATQSTPPRLSHPGHLTATGHGTTQLTAALSFATSGGYLTVIVRNPVADPARYRAEFAAHHLHIALTLVPASPSLVGTLVYFSEPQNGGIVPITADGKCYTGGGGSACPVGLRIPLDFKGSAQITFGRAAKPGEQYETTASATAPGEVMHGMQFKGHTVSQVLSQLRQRDVTVPYFNDNHDNYAKLLRSVPGSWYVYAAVPWASDQVMLFVGPVWPQPAAAAPSPVGGAPVPSPTG
jgi:hypothetical protein